MKLLLCLFSVFIAFSNWSQRNCKTVKIISGDSTVCFHQKGNVSTIAFPSKEHERYYHFQAFDVNGNKVLETSHGVLHGSASLDVKYYENGAIKSARRTFQPDGGIQHYDATTYYHEDGTFSHEEDNSWDRQLTHPNFEHVQPLSIVQQKSDPQDSLSFWLKNTTNRNVKVLVGSKSQSSKKKVVKIKKNSSVSISKFLPMKNVVDPNQYFEIDILPTDKNFQPKLLWSNEFQYDKNCFLLIVFFEK